MATATSYRLICKFKDSMGNDLYHRYRYANSEATADDVKAYMQACITNAAIFQVPPASIESAEIETTSYNELAVV